MKNDAEDIFAVLSNTFKAKSPSPLIVLERALFIV